MDKQQIGYKTLWKTVSEGIKKCYGNLKLNLKRLSFTPCLSAKKDTKLLTKLYNKNVTPTKQ